MVNNLTALAKNKLVLLGIAVLLLLPFLFLYFSSNTPAPTPNQSEPQTSTGATNAPASGNVTPMVTVPAGLQWTTYSGETFTFQYPPDWKIQQYNIEGGGVALVVKPAVLPEGINYPQFVLQTQPMSASSMQAKTAFLEGFGMKRSEITVDGINAIQYKGTVPFKVVGSQTVNEPVQDTTTLVNDKGTLYVLKYEYEGTTPNESLDTYFNDFLLSFKTK
jgi:hypothetical protein